MLKAYPDKTYKIYLNIFNENYHIRTYANMQYLIWKYWNRIVHSLCRSETCIRPCNKYNMTIVKHLYIIRRKLFYENR